MTFLAVLGLDRCDCSVAVTIARYLQSALHMHNATCTEQWHVTKIEMLPDDLYQLAK